MKVVVIGGSGLIGSSLVKKLRESGCETIAASPSTGVNTITGVGLASAVVNAQVVVDVTNAPVFEDDEVLRFFNTSTQHILAAEKAAKVEHHVLLSIVGAQRLKDSGYMGAKVAQETLVKNATIPYTILHSTQFFEFLGGIANANMEQGSIHLPAVLIQPTAAEDVAAALAEVALGPPMNSTIELAGPEQFQLDELVKQFLHATQDPRKVVTDEKVRYFGAVLETRSLLPGENTRIAPTRFVDWLKGRKDLPNEQK